MEEFQQYYINQCIKADLMHRGKPEDKMAKKNVIEKASERKRYDKNFQVPVGQLIEILQDEQEYWDEKGFHLLSDDLRKIKAGLIEAVEKMARQYLNPEETDKWDFLSEPVRRR